MRWEIKAAIITFIIAILADMIFISLLNWPGIGAIVAICIMGAFILYEIRRPGDK